MTPHMNTIKIGYMCHVICMQNIVSQSASSLSHCHCMQPRKSRSSSPGHDYREEVAHLQQATAKPPPVLWTDDSGAHCWQNQRPPRGACTWTHWDTEVVCVLLDWLMTDCRKGRKEGATKAPCANANDVGDTDEWGMTTCVYVAWLLWAWLIKHQHWMCDLSCVCD